MPPLRPSRTPCWPSSSLSLCRVAGRYCCWPLRPVRLAHSGCGGTRAALVSVACSSMKTDETMRGSARAVVARLALLGGLGTSGVWSGAPVPHARASGGHPLTPVIVPITPAGHRPVAAHSPQAYIAARINAHAPLVRVRLVVDGRQVPFEMMGRDALHQSVFYQPAHLAPGTHHAALTAWDAAGAYARRTWTLCIRAASHTHLAWE